jgi:hypothetical protein
MTTATTSRPSSPPATLAWLETFLCGLLAVFLIWKGLVPAWNKLNTDFPNYYLVARLLREGYNLDRVYDWTWLQRIKDHWGLQQSLVGFAGLTPFSALPVLPLTFFSALTAKRIWIVLNLAMLATSVEMLYHFTALRRSTTWLIALLAIVPLRTSFLYGQMHISVLFLMVIAFSFLQRKQDVAGGASIAMAAALKVYPIAFFGYLLLRRRWRGAVATAATLILLLAIGRVLMGQEILHNYAFQQLPRSLQGEVLDPYNISFASGASLLHRLFLFEPELNPSPLINSPTLYSILYPLWQMVITVPLLFLLRPSLSDPDPDRAKVEWAAILLALLTLSPVPSTYHFVVLILPVTLLIDSLLRSHSKKMAAVVIVLYVCVSLVGMVRILSLFSLRLWLLTALYVLSLTYLSRIQPHDAAYSQRRDFAIAFALGVCGFFMGFIGYHHHFGDRDAQMSRRLPVRGSYQLVTAPAVRSDELYFVAITPDGYRILEQNGEAAAAALPFATDQLSFAVAPVGKLLLETADANGSRIRRASDGVTLAADAESPAISPDSHTLAYIRESKGYGRLRTTDLSATHDVQLTSESYDVREAGFLDSSRLLFSARHDGGARLFVVSSGSSPSPFLSISGDIGTFAISPDVQHIAFTTLVNDRWQLAVVATQTHNVTMLTAEDCNAYHPSWWTSTEILYVTDCGRGIGLSALAHVKVFP